MLGLRVRPSRTRTRRREEPLRPRKRDRQIPADLETIVLKAIEKELVSVRLDRSKREVVYNFGAAEGLVLDCARPGWRRVAWHLCPRLRKP